MLTEDFCSLEVAQLLKEKGFNEPCEVWYSEYISQFRGEKYTSIEFDNHNRFEKDYKFLFHAPTHQMAMKWLREVHQLHISIKPTWALGDMREPCRWEYDIINLATSVDPMYYVGKNTYEEAVEAGIKYCLENLL